MSKSHAFTLRVATPDDYQVCKRIANQSANREGLGFFSRVTFNDFARRQETEPRYILRLATTADGTIVGFVRALALLNGEQVTIHEICRDTTQKSQGLGPLMLSAVEERARTQSYQRLFLKAPENIAAIPAYLRYGFSIVATTPARTGEKPSRALVHLQKNITP